MKLKLCFIACLTFSATVWSQQTVAEFNWKDVPPGKAAEYQEICAQLASERAAEQKLLSVYTTNNPEVKIKQAQIVGIEAGKKALEQNIPGLIALLRHGVTPVLQDGREALKIENTNVAPLQLSLLTIAQPKITAQRYAVVGEVRYDAVQGDGFLEMWNYFPPVQAGLPEGEYFSRTLGDSGEMGKISGTSDWRPFLLPFDRTGASGTPTKLQINLVLKGRGTVYIGPSKLVQYPVAKSWFYGNTEHPWWSDRTAGWVGGLGGGIFGCLGGLLGALSGMGKGRGFVIALIRIQIGLGIGLLVAGVVALAQRQPYGVWYPLLLPGVILVAVYAKGLSTIGKRYQEQELRRIQALDASG